MSEGLRGVGTEKPPRSRPQVDSCARESLRQQTNLNRLHFLPSYVLITPAHNEAAFIGRTIESMLRQTHPPVKWVIVDDGSTDTTAAIVSRFLMSHPWIQLIQIPRRGDHSFPGKVKAFDAGYQRIRHVQYDIIGNLDADITVDNDHFEFLVRKFSEDIRLGVAGCVFTEEGYSSERDSFGGHQPASGQCQLFRRECWEQIGGYKLLHAGGEDWMAATTARMLGWKTKSFREKRSIHLRPTGSAQRSIMSASFCYGKQDYYLGGHPLWELFRIAYQSTKRPYLVKGLALGLGYYSALLRRTPRPVSRELMAFHRKEQMTKLKIILKSLLTFNTIDNFNALSD
ncbi:MAG: glycosyltransferase family 2 protein [Acidobacteria bacterium]|nr:glycosyltransferase family 2 protein [Acidobacteriota bacterium]